jgi:salicylate biosynthesis isochorismate synthase
MKGPIHPAFLHADLAEARDRAAAAGEPVLTSCSQPWDDADPIALFVACRGLEQPASLWAIPQQGLSILGLGCALEFRAGPESSWSDLQSQWQRLAGSAVVRGGHRPVLCGGFAFDPSGPDRPMWRDFPAGALTLSRFCLERRHGAARLVVNALVDADTDCAALAARLAMDGAAILSPQPPDGATVVPAAPTQDIAAEDWMRKVSDAVAAIRAGDLHKVVLARTRTMPLAVGIDAVLRTLWATQPDAYLFAFARGDSCFLGASPERLVEFRDSRLATCALAGSAPRSGNPSEDDRLGRGLLGSAKDRHEHALVVDGLRTALAPVCRALDMPAEPRLHKLRHVQHLITPICASPANDAQLLTLLQRLHPTAAVGGLPRDRALAYIRDCEGLGRGWYAGPVGWIDDRGEGEFAVALRSALLRDGHATLFAGCGLVGDSRAEDEYRESEVKMRSMAAALTAEDAQRQSPPSTASAGRLTGSPDSGRQRPAGEYGTAVQLTDRESEPKPRAGV